MTTQTVPEKLSRASVYSLIAEMIRQGLPAPREVSFRSNSITIDLDSIADRLAWQPVFGMRDEIANEQPHPSLTDPAQMDTWITSAWTRWGGWHLSLHGDDPITDEQRRGWMESGRAERHAAYEARQAAEAAESPTADPTGLTYSRADSEPDDPKPVSPARGWHGGAMVGDTKVAELVDETPHPAESSFAPFATTKDAPDPMFPEGELVDETPAWNPETGFFQPGRVPDLVGADVGGLVDVTGPVVRDSSVVLAGEPLAESLIPAPIASHYDAAAEVGEFVCACGEEFGGMDSLRTHIEAGNAAPVSEARR